MSDIQIESGDDIENRKKENVIISNFGLKKDFLEFNISALSIGNAL